MKPNSHLRARVNEEGHLILPPEVAARFGLKPGVEVCLDEKTTSLSLYPAPSHLAKVYIEPTNRCNLDCRTCIRNSWNETLGRMSEQTFSRIIEGLAAFEPRPTVFFGGFGEPLSHPGIVSMVSRAKAVGSRVEMITNGTLLTGDMSERLIEAGLDMLWVSLDGATPESYTDVRLGAALPMVLSNLKTLVRIRGSAALVCSFGNAAPSGPLKPEIGIAFVAMKRNVADLPSVIIQGVRLGATRFLVTNVLPYTPDMCAEALYTRSLSDHAFLPSSSYHVELPRIDIDKTTTEPLFWTMLGGHTMKMGGADFAEGTDRCPFIGKGAAAIGWDGSLVPCLALLHDNTSYLNNRERFSRRHVIGNVVERDLPDLWNDEDYTAFRERVQQFDFSPCTFCGGCDLSEKNEEDCIGNTFPTCGGCLWAQGVVQCP